MTLVFSDIHLGTPVSQHKKVIAAIEKHRPDKIVLAGDIVDINCTRRLKKKEWAFFAYLRKLSKTTEIIYLSGNHDGQIAPFISNLLGFDHNTEHIIQLKSKIIYITHFDIFDSVIGDHPLITNLASGCYYYLQYLDPNEQRLPRFLKHRSKSFLQCKDRVRANAIKFAKEKGYDIIIGGHTHYPEDINKDGIRYINCGCWTEPLNSYVIIDDSVRLVSNNS